MIGSVVLLGGLSKVDIVQQVADQLHVPLHHVGGIQQLAAFSVDGLVAGVLFSPALMGLPWRRALAKIRTAAPAALPILCHRFSDEVEWPEMARAGVFHALHLPFSAHEVRQSLGFVIHARERRKVHQIVRSSTAVA